jgi:hypothetical protein
MRARSGTFDDDMKENGRKGFLLDSLGEIELIS